MFSLLIHGDGTAWETDQLMRMDADRFHEHSGSDGKFISLERPETLMALETLPTLLMYETGAEGPCPDVVRLGSVRDVTASGPDITFHFEEQGRLARSVIAEYAERLGIGRWERNRTHWAVKDGGIPSGVLAEVEEDATEPVTGSGRVAREPRLTFLEKIGEGAFGSVWLCEDTRLGRRVAAKIFKAAGFGVLDWLEQGKALARVDHPNVNRIYSIEEVVHPETGAPGTSALILEYVDGSTLEDSLKAETPPEPKALLNIGLQIIEGLEAIHKKGLNHLDLHEENILVTDEGRVRLIDIQYLNSLAALSTIPKAGRQRRDFDGLYGILTRLLKVAGVPSGNVQSLAELHLGEVFDLSAARDRFQSAFSSPAVRRPLAAPLDPDPLAGRVRVLLAESHIAELDQLLAAQFHRLRQELGGEEFSDSERPTPEMVARRFDCYEAATNALVPTAAILGRWGGPEHGRLFAEHLVGFAEQTALGPGPNGGSYDEATVALAWIPIQRLVYGLGVGSQSRENYAPLVPVLQQSVHPIRELQPLTLLGHLACSYSDLRRTDVDRLLAKEYTPISNRLLGGLIPVLQAHIPVSVQRAEALFDEFEALLCLEHIALHGKWGPPGRFAGRTGYAREQSALATLERRCKERGPQWAVLQAGLFRGSPEAFEAALKTCVDFIAKLRWY